MVRAADVAVYILEKTGDLPAMKLQKLVYYAHAWNLVWDDRPLFSDRIEAWANGPVVPDLYRQHRLQFWVRASDFDGRAQQLDSDERETVDAVLQFYGNHSAHELSQMTHREAPWDEARRSAGLGNGERGSVEITDAAMAEYYGSLIL